MSMCAMCCISLEDGQQCLLGRLNPISGNRACADLLTLVTGTATYAEAIAYIIVWLDEHFDDARLVVVDVFAKIKPKTNGERSVYDEDYAALALLLEMCGDHGLLVMLSGRLLLRTLRGGVGSAGVTGAADVLGHHCY